MRTISFLVFMIVFIVVLSNIAAIVERSNGIPDVFQIMFPEKYVDQEDIKAIETEMAPFAEAENAAEPVQLDPEIEYDPLGDSVVVSKTLNIPHRHEAAVSSWIGEVIGEALTFMIKDYDQHLAEVDEYMNANALKEYQAFLNDSKVLALMQNRNFELKTFVTDVPKLAASGVARGRYRWVYDIPVNMTFLPIGTESYKGLAPQDFVSEKVTIRVQAGRVAEGGRDGIELETWEVLKTTR